MIDAKQLTKVVDDVVCWIRTYIEKTHANGVVVGNSGGKDSATVIALAVQALGKERVLTVAMPCNSISKDLKDAELVSKSFDVPLMKIDLTNTYMELEKNLTSSLDLELSKESTINIKPRLRMTSLYAIAQTKGYLVIGTGNLCEAMVGYTTKWGDSAYDFNPIAQFTVEEVKQIGLHLGVPKEIINKAPSDGLGELTDEEKMGVKYEQISEFIETGKTDEKVIKIIKRLNENSKHKRNMPPKFEYKRKTFLS